MSWEVGMLVISHNVYVYFLFGIYIHCYIVIPQIPEHIRPCPSELSFFVNSCLICKMTHVFFGSKRSFFPDTPNGFGLRNI